MKRFSAIIVLVLLVCSIILPCNIGACHSARAMCVYQPDTETFLECYQGDVRLPMASTTKIMTALVVLQNTDISTEIKIPSVAVGVEGSSMYLAEGEILSIKELLYGLMLTSGNDAATALAHYVGGGSIDSFVSMMNKKAASLSLSDTNFTNPSGLPDDNHYTTANDLAKITAAALSDPTFAQIVSESSVKIRYRGTPGGRTLTNHNKLLSMYDGAIGVKTGFTKKAGRCLVSAANRDGITLICVTLNDGDDWNDHMTALDNGFSRVRRELLSDKMQITVDLCSPDGRTVCARNTQKLECIVIDNKLPLVTVETEKFVYPPKQKNTVVGSVRYLLDGKTVAYSELRLCETLDMLPENQNNFLRFLNYIRNIFKWNNS